MQNQYTGDNATIGFSADLAFEYPKSVEIKAPEGAKPIKEIVESAFDEYMGLMELYAGLDEE